MKNNINSKQEEDYSTICMSAARLSQKIQEFNYKYGISVYSDVVDFFKEELSSKEIKKAWDRRNF